MEVPNDEGLPNRPGAHSAPGVPVPLCSPPDEDNLVFVPVAQRLSCNAIALEEGRLSEAEARLPRDGRPELAQPSLRWSFCGGAVFDCVFRLLDIPSAKGVWRSRQSRASCPSVPAADAVLRRASLGAGGPSGAWRASAERLLWIAVRVRTQPRARKCRWSVGRAPLYRNPGAARFRLGPARAQPGSGATRAPPGLRPGASVS